MQTFLFEKSVPSLPSTCQPLDSRWHAHALIPAPPTKHPSKRDTRSPWAFEFMWLIHAQALWYGKQTNDLKQPIFLTLGSWRIFSQPKSESEASTWLGQETTPPKAIPHPEPGSFPKNLRPSQSVPHRLHASSKSNTYLLLSWSPRTHTDTHTHRAYKFTARAHMWDAAVEAPRTVNSPTHRSIAHKTTSEPGCCFHWVDRNYRWELICGCSKGLQKRDPLIILLTLFRSNM